MPVAEIRFVENPTRLPVPPPVGTTAMVDLAFAVGTDFDASTKPFIDALGERLVAWVDHHDHPAWTQYEGDERFVLVGKLQARACPQLITPDLVKRLGTAETIFAHADLDGCIAAAKLARGGEPPYEEADEDARAADAPGKGFVFSTRGLRYAQALDYVSLRGDWSSKESLLQDIGRALVDGRDSHELEQTLTQMCDALQEHRQTLAPILDRVEHPHPEISVVHPQGLGSADKKYLLRQMQQSTRVAVAYEGGWSTAATFDDESLDLASLPGLRGQRGYAFGEVPPEHFLQALSDLLRGRP